MAALTTPPEVDSVPPSLRVLVAATALFLFRWSLCGTVSMATTAEIEAREQTRRLIEETQSALHADQYERALLALADLTRLQPNNQVYWWQRALVAGKLQRPRDEVEALERFVKLSPLPDEACPRLGLLYRELGLASEAMNAFERCVAFAPNDTEMSFYLGHAYEMEGQIDRALEVYTGALRHSINADVEAGIGRLLLRKGKPEAAYQAVAGVLARNPNNVDAILVAGLAMTRLGKPAQARALLERGVAHHDGADLRYALGVVAEMQGRSADARSQYDAALTLDPDHQDAKTRRDRFAARGRR
jgi:tetratricopeptide (TPR) repeat protein